MARRADGVELIISAKDESEKAFKEVTDALKELETAAKSGMGLNQLFIGLEARLDSLSKKQQQVNKSLGDATGIQRSLDSAKRFTEVLEDQEKAAAKAQQRLSQLEEEFAGIEAAANQARMPSERLVQSLDNQRARQSELAKSIAETRAQIERSNAALQQNAGLDEKAAAAIEKQNRAVIASGQAWRSTTQAIKAANDTIRAGQAERDVLTPLRDQATAQLKQLQAEFQRVQVLARGFERSAKKEDAGGAVQALARSAQQRLAALRTEIDQQKNVQAELNKQLSAVNRSIDRQGASVEKLTVKAKEQRTTYQSLKNSLADFSKAAQTEGAARQVAGIERLQKSLVDLQDSYDKTTVKVRQANQALAAASGPDPKAIAAREAYQKRIGEAIAAAQREQAELARLRVQFQQAGVSTEQLASRQRELDQVTERLTAEQAKLVTQVKAVDTANKGASGSSRSLGAAIASIGKDTRQSLGYLQRLRGELLSIAATYTGLYAVGGAIRSIYQASVLVNQAEARFSSFFKGDNAAVAEEMEFVRKESDRLKISFETTLNQYSKFVASMPKGKVPLEDIRFVFTGIAETARVAGLSTEAIGSTFNALSQIVSKSTLSMEELGQQLGDHIPGAIERTAEGLGITSQELRKIVESGEGRGVPALILLANQLQKDFGSQVPKALESASASLADFENAVFDLRRDLAESGFIDVLIEGLKEATEAIKSPEFRQGAREFASAIGELIQVGVALIKNFDDVKAALKALLGFFIAQRVVAFATAIHAAGAALTTYAAAAGLAGTATGKLVAAMGFLLRSFALVGTALATGLAIGTYLNKEYAEVQKFGVALIAGFDKIFIDIGALWEKMLAGWDDGFDHVMDAISGRVRTFIQDTGNKLANLLPEDAGDRLREALKFEEEDTGPSKLEQRFADIEAAAKKAKDVVDDIATQMFQDIDAEFAKREGKPVIDAEATKKAVKEANKAITEGLLSDERIAQLQKEFRVVDPEKAAKELEALQQRVRDALLKIDAEIQERAGNTLEERLGAIKAEFAKLQRDIEKAGGAKAFPSAQGSIEQLTAIKQVAETEKEISALIQERRALIGAINEQSELGVITVEEATKRINTENARILPELNNALAVAQRIAGEINSKPVSQSVDTQGQLVALENERAKREQLLALEERINQVMEVRSARIQTINAQVEAGTLGEIQGRNQIFEINRQTGEQLDELIQKSITMAQAMGDPLMVERLRQVKIELSQVKAEIVNAGEINQNFASGFAGAFEQVITKAQSAKEAFRAFAVDFLKQIARMIMQQMIFNAISGGTGGGGLGGAIAGAVNHTGGIVGLTGTKRLLPRAAFANAVKYHNGGIAGLKPNEVPTVLEKGEEVLTRNDPRHQANGGGQSSPVQVKIVNTIDSASVLNEALSSAAGEKILMNSIRANKSAIKSVLG